MRPSFGKPCMNYKPKSSLSRLFLCIIWPQVTPFTSAAIILMPLA